MRTAFALHIPLSVGRGTRRPSSRWSEQDWLIAQAFQEMERSTCSGCGVPMSQGMDPTLQDRWRAGLPYRCHPCTAIKTKASEYAESDVPEALRFPVQIA